MPLDCVSDKSEATSGGTVVGYAAAAAAADAGNISAGDHVAPTGQRSQTLHLTLHGTRVVLKRTVVVLVYLVALVLGVVVAGLYVAIVLPSKMARRRFCDSAKDDEVLTNDWWGLHDGDDVKSREKARPKAVNMRKDVELRTCYITARDGIKLATDVWIPVKALKEKKTLPVVFHQARYYRSATLRWPFNLIVNGGKPISFINDPFFKSFLSHNLILVSVDVRGTGASFGTHPGPWSYEEQQDSLEVLDWIDRQPWSNGRVALWGVSYEGTSAFFTSLLRHPTVVCCCPMFFFWDVYDDISHPGGVPMRHFSVSWQGFNDNLDSGWVQSTGWMARIFLEGVTPVATEDPWGYQANQAIMGHKGNWSLLNDGHIRYMDDTSSHTGRMVKCACASEALQQLLAEHFGGRGGDAGGSTRSGPVTSSSPSTTSTLKGDEQGGPSPAVNADGDGDLSIPTAEAGSGDQTTTGDSGLGGSRSGDSGRKGTPEALADDRRGVSQRRVVSDEHRDQRERVRGRGGGDPFGCGSDKSLEEALPYYLHVSGWLDASAHAAVMAFATVPCRGSELLVGPWSHGGHQHVRPHHTTTRSKFDFTTEVSGFFIRRLSTPSSSSSSPAGSNGVARAVDRAAAVPPTTGSHDHDHRTSVTAEHQPAIDVGSAGSAAAGATGVRTSATATTIEASSTSASATSPASAGATSGVPLVSSDAFLPASDGRRRGGGGGGGGEGEEEEEEEEGAETEGVAEGARLLPESRGREVMALWKEARPRVRYFTHQEERWHEAEDFPSSTSHKTNLALFLGGERQKDRSRRQNRRQPRQKEEQPQGSQFPPHPAEGMIGLDIGAGGRTIDPDPDRVDGPTRVSLKNEESEGVEMTPVPTVDVEAVDGANEHPRVATTAGSYEDGRTDGNDEEARGTVVVGSEKHQLLPRGVLAASSPARGLGGTKRGERGMGGLKDKVSKRLTSWPSFGKPKLTLSQVSEGEQEERIHELEVDVLKDHDGEGISRWAAMTEFWSLISYQMDGMRSNHLRFTSAPLTQDIEVTGYPVVSLWMSAADDLPNLDVFAYLQAVRPRTGLSIYVTEGCFRAEHRKEAERTDPVDVRALPGVPIHSYLRADAQPLVKGQPTEIRFKLMPTSFQFLKGQRVRLSIGGADARHFHPITESLAQDSSTSPPSPPADLDRREERSPGQSPGSVGAGRVLEKRVLEKRVLRVHTGGSFASGVSLPLPRCGNSGLTLETLTASRDARRAAAPPRIARLARNLWRKHARSKSVTATLSDSESVSSPKRDSTAVRRRSEGLLQDVVDLPSLRASTDLFEG